jgi:hypothetical protein
VSVRTDSRRVASCTTVGNLAAARGCLSAQYLAAWTNEVLHVGAGYLTDMVPAFVLGIPRIWINRRGEVGDRHTPPTHGLPRTSPICQRVLKVSCSATETRVMHGKRSDILRQYRRRVPSSLGLRLDLTSFT